MPFEKGNKMWMFREKVGRDLEYETPEELIEGILSYVEWNDANPWYKIEQLKKPVLTGIDEKGQKIYQTVAHIPTARPMSIEGLCNHLCIHHKTWKEYLKRDAFRAIVMRTEQFIRTQQFEGAAVGVFHQAIMAPTLGLINKSETGYRDKDGNPIDPPKPVVITAIFPNTEKDI
jgi:hypothetical protein